MVLLISMLSAWFLPWQTLMSGLERRLTLLLARPRVCLLGIFAISVLLRVTLLPVEPVPTPLFHDEFSYLLGADTFLHGRLTNPQPPVPIAFETIHTNMWPTFQTMYT